jgi:hypothetical protein
MFTTFFCSAMAQEPLQTERDSALAETIREAQTETSSMLRSTQSARMSRLRNTFQNTLSQHDFAAQFRTNSLGVINSKKESTMALENRLQGVFQFATNWQADFTWLQVQQLSKGSAPLQKTPRELPVLDALSLSYGKERSVETKVGLMTDAPLLKGDTLPSIFSGIAVLIHPVHQKVSLQKLIFQADFEHGWNSFTNDLSPEGLSTLQRTRPRLALSYKDTPLALAAKISLEWYSDSDSVLGRVLNQRASVLRNSSASVQETEKRWRLFVLSGTAEYETSRDQSFEVSGDRVTNTIGASTIPAWSIETGLNQSIPSGPSDVRLSAAIQRFSSPFGSIPQARLPLVINPGTHGTTTRAQVSWNPSSQNYGRLFFQIGYHRERPIGGSAVLHCTSTPQSIGTQPTQACSTLWGNLAWTLKLPTKL